MSQDHTTLPNTTDDKKPTKAEQARADANDEVNKSHLMPEMPRADDSPQQEGESWSDYLARQARVGFVDTQR